MRGLVLLLCCIPSIAAAEISVIDLPLQHELPQPVWPPVTPVSQVVVSGKRIAVLSPNEVVHIFEQQPDRSWLRLSSLGLSDGGPPGPIIHFDFDGQVIVYTRRDPPGQVQSLPDFTYRVFALEADDAAWQGGRTNSLGFSNGQVATSDGRVAVSTVRGVNIYSKASSFPGNWGAPVLLDKEGTTRVGQSPGPQFSFDGNRVLIGTNGFVVNPFGSFEYWYNYAVLYERNAANSWILRDRLRTERSGFNATTASSVPVWMEGDDASLAGRTFHPNQNGEWLQIGNFSTPSVSPSSSARFDVMRGGFGLLYRSAAQRDIYERDAQGYWTPLARLRESGPAILAVGESVAVSQVMEDGVTRLYVTDLDSLRSATPRPATFAGVEVREGAVVPGGTLQVTASAWIAAGNANVRSIEARVAGGAWQALPAYDGAFGDPYETARGLIAVPLELQPIEAADNQVRVSIRVTDSLGRVTEMLDTIMDPASVVEIIDPLVANSETTPPTISEVSFFQNAIVPFGETPVVNAFVDDSRSGGNVKGIHFRLDDDTVWRTFQPFPGFDGPFVFSRPWEAGRAILPPASAPGIHSIWLRSVDAAGNVSGSFSVDFTVTPPP